MRNVPSFLIIAFISVSANAQTLTLDVGRLYDVEQQRVLTAQRLSITDGRITAIAAIDKPNPAALDWRDKALLPGWIDLHTHLIGEIQNADVLAPLHSSTEADLALGARHALATLQAGFTTVRDVGSYRGLVDVSLRDQINRGALMGPTMFVAGAYLTRRGGGGEVIGGRDAQQLPSEFRLGVADTEAELRERVRLLARGGVDFLKVIATGAVLTNGTTPGESEFSIELLRAIVDEAKKYALDVTAHAHGAQGIKDAIRAGVRSIEHASLIDDEGIALAKQHDVFLVMDIYNGDYIDEIGKKEMWSAEILRKNSDTTAAQRAGFRRAVAAGVRVVFGTDSGVFPHGDNAKQFAVMQRFGMSEMQVLRAATLDAAQLLRQEQQIGSIRVGKYADLVALPLPKSDGQLDFSQRPRVIKRGVLLP